MITVFHKGDAPGILAALKSRGLAFTTYDLRACPPEAGWAAGMHLREIGRAVMHEAGLDSVWEVLTPTTTIDNALGRSIIAGDYPETVLGKLPEVIGVHEPREDGLCSCKTSHTAQVLAEVNVTEPRSIEYDDDGQPIEDGYKFATEAERFAYWQDVNRAPRTTRGSTA